MAELVANNVVKMDWNKNEFLTKKSKLFKGEEVFAVAFRTYERLDGKKLLVTFRPGLAFIWGNLAGYYDDKENFDVVGNTWDKNSQINFVTEHLREGGYPDEYEDNCILIADVAHFYSSHQAPLQLSDADAQDIVNRCADLSPYGEEREWNPSMMN